MLSLSCTFNLKSWYKNDKAGKIHKGCYNQHSFKINKKVRFFLKTTWNGVWKINTFCKKCVNGSWIAMKDHSSLTVSPDFISILFPLLVSTPKTPFILMLLISNGYKFTDGHLPLVQNIYIKMIKLWRLINHVAIIIHLKLGKQQKN